MKFKNCTVLITLAVVLCITAFSFPVSANVPENEELSVNDNVESTSPLTPGGNLTIIDDVHQVTDTSDENKIENKQFITVEYKNIPEEAKRDLLISRQTMRKEIE